MTDTIDLLRVIHIKNAIKNGKDMTSEIENIKDPELHGSMAAFQIIQKLKRMRQNEEMGVDELDEASRKSRAGKPKSKRKTCRCKK